MCFRLVSFVFGWKLVRIICFKNKNNGNMYLLFTGTNIQNYGIRYNSNNNLQRLYDQRIRSPNILAEIDRRIRIKNNEAINPYYNILEGLNSLNVLNKTYNSIRMNQFKIDVNINNLFEIKVTKIIIPLDTSIDDISFGSTINYADLSFNDRTKFANMYTYLTSKYTNIQIGDYACVANECIIPQIPPDLHNTLAERTAARILAAIGDTEGLQASNAKLQEIETRQGTILDDRVEGSPQKITARHSLLRYGKMGTRKRT
jgi:hypothetical protein